MNSLKGLLIQIIYKIEPGCTFKLSLEQGKVALYLEIFQGIWQCSELP